MEAGLDEHLIRCSQCGRALIVKDNVNNGVAFLSHLKNDHGVYYTALRMAETKEKRREDLSRQTLVGQDKSVDSPAGASG